ncbi:DUF433 domain-containing protein [Variovorax sp. YR750]|uniref:DUF433 domain-containing protein n=1 Tax=Variovorax sp. YR750 TaxID=1884384 RepID=UPI000B84FD5C|nr:DUF433 domain-containing protein [Variovorax sp. YR750]
MASLAIEDWPAWLGARWSTAEFRAVQCRLARRWVACACDASVAEGVLCSDHRAPSLSQAYGPLDLSDLGIASREVLQFAKTQLLINNPMYRNNFWKPAMTEMVMRQSSATEAAFIANVDERDIHRLVDEELLPPLLLEAARAARRFDTFVCVLGSFYFHESAALTKDARKKVMGELAERIGKSLAVLADKQSANVSTLNWTVSIDDVICVNLKGLAEETAHRAAVLAKAEALVNSDEATMGGEPVFVGTRVPVRTVATWIASGESKKVIRESFPTLTDEMVEAAPLWVKTHPQRGRPKSFGDLNPGWKTVSSKRVKLGAR